MEANYFTILYWFCHTSTWICHGYTGVPNPEPPSHLPRHTIPLGLRFFHFVASISTSFFSITDALISWDFLDALVNGIVFSISFMIFSFLLYRTIINFHVLILYPPTLLNSFIRSIFLCVGFLGYSIWKIMSPVKVVILFFLFQFSSAFYFLSCFISLDRISSAMLSVSSESRYLVFFLILKSNRSFFRYWVRC